MTNKITDFLDGASPDQMRQACNDLLDGKFNKDLFDLFSDTEVAAVLGATTKRLERNLRAQGIKKSKPRRGIGSY